MRTGIATVPLDYGRCPRWLFERMKRLGRGISVAIVEEFGPEEFLNRLADPVWFQSLGCTMAFDWNSSGLTTTTLGALKEGLRGLENDLGVFICGGKGRTSRKTPEQIRAWGASLGMFPESVEKLVYTSKISAKIDSSCLQDGYNLYHHNLIFSKIGHWAVVQQGMAEHLSRARRYHWLSSKLKKRPSGKQEYIEEPHSGIISQARVRPLNLTARESRDNRAISADLIREEPRTFLKDFKLLFNNPYQLMRAKRTKNLTLMELNKVEFHWHPVLRERFDLKRLERTIFFAKEHQPHDFEALLALTGIGPKTIRALSLVAEIIYGARPSFEDPARYSFSFGGKDATPYPVDKMIYDRVLEVMERGIQKSAISLLEKEKARRRLLGQTGFSSLTQ